MDIKAWYGKRSIGFIIERGKRLGERYRFTTQKSVSRIEDCIHALHGYGCYPTFAVPGMVVERNLPFIMHLQQAGAEIAVHGYNHVDFKSYPPEEASRQLSHAVQVFQQNGLEVHGFRCPYLSASDDLIKALPPGQFEYSSNKAIAWPICRSVGQPASLLFETIEKFYIPKKAEEVLCLPWFQDGLVEIPVYVPDDLQLHDGLGYGLKEISRIWLDILHQTHRRGEVFNLMFHPELASFCEAPFLIVLEEACSLQPKVWIARLREVSDWWREKANFWVEAAISKNSSTLQFHASPRGTILCRGFDPQGPTSAWDGRYRKLDRQVVTINTTTLPFIGVPSESPEWVISTLEGMGFILRQGKEASQCSLYLDTACLSRLNNPVDLVTYIEGTREPLVRFWPWPDGARSALCITGDLDALSLFDYAFRLLKK